MWRRDIGEKLQKSEGGKEKMKSERTNDAKGNEAKIVYDRYMELLNLSQDTNICSNAYEIHVCVWVCVCVNRLPNNTHDSTLL